MNKKRHNELQGISKNIRRHIVRMHAKADASHVASSLSCVDILAALFFGIMKIDPVYPKGENRDRFILSKGHAASALYATLAKRGFFGESLLEEYCVNGGRLPGHSTKDCAPGVEVSTGSLGHGLLMAVGMAVAAKYDKRSYRIFVLLSDGECNEGSIWEAALFASHHKLDNVIAIIDYNKLQAFGRSEDILGLEPFKDKWTSFGWSVKEADGHDFKEIIGTLKKVPFKSGRPSLIIAHTVKGKGVSYMENKVEWHYKAPNKEELGIALRELKSS